MVCLKWNSRESSFIDSTKIASKADAKVQFDEILDKYFLKHNIGKTVAIEKAREFVGKAINGELTLPQINKPKDNVTYSSYRRKKARSKN